MKIGKIAINSKLALAPMAGVTDLGFRTVCRELGAEYTVAEMINAKALYYQDKKSFPLLELGRGEHLAAVQLFDSDPYCMEQTVGITAEKSGTDILDISMGYPILKVTNSGDGSGLIRNPEPAVKVAEAVIRGAGRRPVTIKLRLDWDKGSINCMEFAQAMEVAGMATVTVHGRTKAQVYSGRANWDYIRAIEEAMSTPVFANGGVFGPKDAVRILKYTGANTAMLDRGCFGNPWLFARAQTALEGRPVPPLPPLARRYETTIRQFRLSATQRGEHIARLEARRHYTWYLKGVPYTGYYKEQISRISILEDTDRVTADMQRNLRD